MTCFLTYSLYPVVFLQFIRIFIYLTFQLTFAVRLWKDSLKVSASVWLITTH